MSLIAQGYPRGSKQLIGPFKSLFGPADAATWFRSRGVELKTEGDGRMFPRSDNSQTIIDCLQGVRFSSCAFFMTLTRMSYFPHQREANCRNMLTAEAIQHHLTMFLQKVMTTRKHTLYRAAPRFLPLDDINKNNAVPSCRPDELSRRILSIVKKSIVLYN